MCVHFGLSDERSWSFCIFCSPWRRRISQTTWQNNRKNHGAPHWRRNWERTAEHWKREKVEVFSGKVLQKNGQCAARKRVGCISVRRRWYPCLSKKTFFYEVSRAISATFQHQRVPSGASRMTRKIKKFQNQNNTIQRERVKQFWIFKIKKKDPSLHSPLNRLFGSGRHAFNSLVYQKTRIRGIYCFNRFWFFVWNKKQKVKNK